MTFTGEVKSGMLVLHLEGDLVGAEKTVPLLDSVAQAIGQQVLTCVLEISQLRYLNSAGVGVLITILTKFRNKGGEVFLMNPSESVKKLLVTTKLNAIFQTVQTEADALSKTVR